VGHPVACLWRGSGRRASEGLERVPPLKKKVSTDKRKKQGNNLSRKKKKGQRVVLAWGVYRGLRPGVSRRRRKRRERQHKRRRRKRKTGRHFAGKKKRNAMLSHHALKKKSFPRSPPAEIFFRGGGRLVYGTRETPEEGVGETKKNRTPCGRKEKRVPRPAKTKHL